MLKYTKTILRKVSFDASLFRKELAKSFQYLVKEDIDELLSWVITNFDQRYYLKPVYVGK